MKRILLWTVCLLILVPLGFLGYTYYEITTETSERISRGAIDRVINSESPVYYSDGQTPIGVFFEKTHSKYIDYDRIPKIFIKALIAAEDKNFFHHWGFDPKSIARAFVANFKSGRVVQGGSTLTQQTAKNVFKREKRSYQAKIHEMFQAFLLEREYTKEEILEMYTNQFFVNGYGKGLRIATQYFFDKDPHDLNLVEAAFIVGSVKGPNKYNPFIKKTQSEKAKAKRLAKARKDYVLDKMLEQNYISTAECTAAKEKPIPFKEGRITFRLNVILDYIRNQLESDFFKEILQEQGVNNIATSGISIYTSVDREIQNAALLSLRKHLPQMDVGLTGLAPSKTLSRWKGDLNEDVKGNNRAIPFLARVTAIRHDVKDPGLHISWENREAFMGYDGLKPIGDAWLKGKTGPWATFKKEHVPLLLNTLKVGDLAPVQIITVEKGSKGEEQVENLVLSAIPELEGGVVTLHQGMIQAMVGGFSNIHFNRAVDAKRQLGSIFKPIVYASALQLKWNNLDPLKNTKDIYQFEGTTYVPNPDHKPKSETVSMAWAGSNSENLASVWLLYHLTDRLNMSEFRQVVNLVGLGRKPDEPYEAYKTRIRDRMGIVVDQKAIMEAAFEAAKAQAETDIIFSGHENMLDHVNRLHFNLADTGSEVEDKDRNLLRYDFQRLLALKNNTREAQWVDGLIPSEILKLLETHTQNQFRKLMGQEKYSLEVLSKIRDFRTLVNLSFVIYLSKKIGISTHLDAVLSFPLGPNAISIMEAALAYETLLTGKTYTLGASGGPAMVPIIKKIVDREGRTLWEYIPEPKEVLPERVTILTSEILRKVMERGTGKKAGDTVRVFDIPLPSFGKTGTANRYTNSSFVGLIPGPDDVTGQLNIDNGYTIASYVGYDDNQPMKGDHMALYGSSGALPLWMDTARAIAKSEDFKNILQPADLAFNPLLRPAIPGKSALHPVPVSTLTGLPLKNGEKPLRPSKVPEVLTQAEERGKTWHLKREFEPF
jgi:penicillin-binding protein 1A